ncbi:unnamed protein product [Rhizoctonia solani]|uniref:BAG domain-containing protein n=1 Tax=Rhizoctonia solani TaxID=456999 RepID=A0A8H3GWK9_9AGAM|nr:unnamed protein product [Rhizoctonia solani]
MAYYYQPYVYPQHATIQHYAGGDPYGSAALDYYPAAPPVQVVSLAPWGSYAEYVHEVFQRRAYDSDWYLRQSRTRVDPTEAHNAIQEVLREVQARVNSFHYPDHLDFQQYSANGLVPQLADTKRNSAVNEHHRKLEELLKQLQDVKARGDGTVKRAKADAIARVKEELEELKRKKAAIWYNSQADGRPRKHFWAIWS